MTSSPQTPLDPPMLDAPRSATVAVLFYRSHYLAGNTAPIDALCQALENQGLTAIAIYVSSLREADVQAEILAILENLDLPLGAILNTTSFSLAK
ncbi:MAG: cobaltochelatase subunit CobN, partial [Synechocystis sp.]|nr:cobaltochelatase subunit CobN [Synechocystis sp.]